MENKELMIAKMTMLPSKNHSWLIHMLWQESQSSRVMNLSLREAMQNVRWSVKQKHQDLLTRNIVASSHTLTIWLARQKFLPQTTKLRTEALWLYRSPAHLWILRPRTLSLTSATMFKCRMNVLEHLSMFQLNGTICNLSISGEMTKSWPWAVNHSPL